MKTASRSLSKDLTSGSVFWTMVTFSLPLFFSGLLQTVYNLTDMIIVGHAVGRDGLGAISIGSDILHFLMFIALGFSNAGQVIISQFTGAGLKGKVRKTIGTLFSFLLASSIIIGVWGFVFAEQILSWVNTPQEAWQLTLDYFRVCMGGMVFIYGYNIVSAILRGMGNSRHPFYFVAISVVINIVLDLIFVVWFKWALLGAAWATVISQAASFLFALSFLYRNRKVFGFGFRKKDFKIDRSVLVPLLKLGIPMIIQSASISFSMLFVNSWINTYGVVAAAMTGVGNKISSLVNVINFALGTAGSSMIGQCLGAEKYERVPEILKVSLGINGLIALFAGIIVVLVPGHVFGIFTSDRQVLQMAMTYIPVLLLLFGGAALRPPMSSLINGSGNFRLNLAVALLDGVFMRIGLSLLLGLTFGMGVYGFWYGHALAGFTPFVIGGTYFLSGKWRTRKHIINR